MLLLADLSTIDTAGRLLRIICPTHCTLEHNIVVINTFSYDVTGISLKVA
jgi:hypothetical protein